MITQLVWTSDRTCDMDDCHAAAETEQYTCSHRVNQGYLCQEHRDWADSRITCFWHGDL